MFVLRHGPQLRPLRHLHQRGAVVEDALQRSACVQNAILKELDAPAEPAQVAPAAVSAPRPAAAARVGVVVAWPPLQRCRTAGGVGTLFAVDEK